MANWQSWTLISSIWAIALVVITCSFMLKKRLEMLYVITAQVLAEIHKGNRDRREEWRQSKPDAGD